MKNMNLKKSLILSIVGIFVFSFLAISVNAQRSKLIKIQRLTTKGLKEFQAEQYDAGIKTFTQCIAFKPLLQNANNCYFGRGIIYFLTKDYVKAIPDFTAAFKSTIDKNSKYMRGRSYVELSKYDEAFEDFNYLINLSTPEDIKKDYPEIYTFRGGIYVIRGDLDKAIADYTKNIEIEPTFADAYFSRGLAYDMKNNLDKAETDLKKALKLDPLMKTDVEEVFKRIEQKRMEKR